MAIVKPPKRHRPARIAARVALGAPLAAAAGWIAYSALAIPHRLPLPPALDGERRTIQTSAGTVSFYVDGPQRPTDDVPILLVHSVNAAGSAYEVRPLFEHYRRSRTVYALDLPGYGFSQRGDRHYTPRMMTDAIHAVVAAIGHGAGVDAIAVSLSSEFLARAALEAPEAFRSIGLVSPTGFDSRGPYEREPGTTRGKPLVRGTFRFPVWSQAFFDLLTTRASVRFFLEKTWGSKHIDDGLLDYDILTTHQPGARFVVYDFVSGHLFSADISRVYAALTLPVWAVHGIRGDFIDYAGIEQVVDRPNWTVTVMPTGAMPQFERLPDFVKRYDAFVDRAVRQPRA